MPVDWHHLGAIAQERARGGILAGVVAFWASYAVTFVFVYFGPSFASGTLSEWTGYYLFGAHNVPVRGSAMGESGLYNVVELPGGADFVPAVVYYAIPVLAIMACGYALRASASPNLDRIESAVVGGTITFGYLASVLLAVALFSRPALADPTYSVTLYVAGPELLRATLFAGLAYPLAFGGIAGVLANPRP